MYRFIPVFVLLLNFTYNLQSKNLIHNLPDLYAINFPNTDFILFRRYEDCLFYYSFSTSNYVYFWNNETEMWEVGQNIMIEENCELILENHTEALYERKAGSNQDGHLKCKSDKSKKIDIVGLRFEYYISKMKISNKTGSLKSKNKINWDWPGCREHAFKSTDIDSCIILTSLSNTYHGHFDQCSYIPLMFNTNDAELIGDSSAKRVQVLRRENCSENNNNPYVYQNEKKNIPLYLYIGAGCGGFLLLLVVILSSKLFCRRKKTCCFKETAATDDDPNFDVKEENEMYGQEDYNMYDDYEEDMNKVEDENEYYESTYM